jgi:hypothetical protein
VSVYTVCVPSTTPEQPTPPHVDKEPVDLKRELERLDKLKADFDHELVTSEKTGDYDRVFEIKKEIDDGLAAIRARIETVQAFENTDEKWEHKFHFAREILGQDALGPDQIEQAFGPTFDRDKIPIIPFTIEDLERAKELNQFLILRSRTIGNTAATIRNLDSEVERRASPYLRKLFRNPQNYSNETFFRLDTPLPVWSIAAKMDVSSTGTGDYLERTTELINYIVRTEFKDRHLPRHINDAINQFEGKKAKIFEELTTDPRHAALELEQLKINKFFGISPVEVAYDVAVQSIVNSQYIYQAGVWTNRRVAGGKIVALNSFTNSGSDILLLEPARQQTIGMGFSRLELTTTR